MSNVPSTITPGGLKILHGEYIAVLNEQDDLYYAQAIVPKDGPKRCANLEIHWLEKCDEGYAVDSKNSQVDADTILAVGLRFFEIGTNRKGEPKVDILASSLKHAQEALDDALKAKRKHVPELEQHSEKTNNDTKKNSGGKATPSADPYKSGGKRRLTPRRSRGSSLNNEDCSQTILSSHDDTLLGCTSLLNTTMDSPSKGQDNILPGFNKLDAILGASTPTFNTGGAKRSLNWSFSPVLSNVTEKQQPTQARKFFNRSKRSKSTSTIFTSPSDPYSFRERNFPSPVQLKRRNATIGTSEVGKVLPTSSNTWVDVPISEEGEINLPYQVIIGIPSDQNNSPNTVEINSKLSESVQEVESHHSSSDLNPLRKQGKLVHSDRSRSSDDDDDNDDDDNDDDDNDDDDNDDDDEKRKRSRRKVNFRKSENDDSKLSESEQEVWSHDSSSDWSPSRKRRKLVHSDSSSSDDDDDNDDDDDDEKRKRSRRKVNSQKSENDAAGGSSLHGGCAKPKNVKPGKTVSVVQKQMRKTMCIFCNNVVVASKLARHFYLKHKKEPELREVTQLYALSVKKKEEKKKKENEEKENKKKENEEEENKKKEDEDADKDGEDNKKKGKKLSEEEKKRTALLKEKMKHWHLRCVLLFNTKVQEGVLEENFVPGRRPRQPVSASEYRLCPDCGKGLLIHNLARHTRRDCPAPRKPIGSLEQKIKTRRYVVAEANMLLPTTCRMSKKFYKEVIKRMNPNMYTNTIMSDPLMIRRGEKLWKFHQHYPLRVNYVRGKLLDMAKLFCFMSNERSQITKVEQLIDPTLYEDLVDGVEKVCEKTEDGYFKRPTLAIKIGSELRRYAELLRRDCLMRTDCEKKYEKMERFLKVMQFWNEDVAHFARRTLVHGINKKALGLPLAEDLEKLHKHLVVRKREAIKCLKYEDADFNQAYHLLAKILMCQIIMFNCKRAGEIHCIKLETFTNMKVEVDPEAMHLLEDETEQKLAKTMTLIKTLGKNDTLVPVLLTAANVKGLNMLIKARHHVVPSTNQYLFANGSSDGFHNVSRALRKFAFEAKVLQPDNITSRSLRKHVATMSQLLNLNLEDRAGLQKFLSHTPVVHNKFYNKPLDAVTLARTSRILYAVSKGPGAYKGKAIKDITETDFDKMDENYELEEETDDSVVQLESCNTTSNSTIQVNSVENVDGSGWEEMFGDISESDDERPVRQKKSKGRKKTPNQKRSSDPKAWDVKQIDFLKKHFHSQFATGKTVSVHELKDVLRKNPLLFHGRDADALRHCVNNIKRKL